MANIGHGGGGYSLNPNKPAFSLLDDEDRMTSEFLNSSGATYLAADRLPPSPEQQAAREAEIQRQELLRQMRQVEQRTLESSKRSIGLLHESEKVGIETAEEMVKQRDQLKNTETRLDTMTNTLQDSQKNLNGIKSVFSSLKTWWTTPKQAAATKENATSPTSPTSPTQSTAINASSNPHLGSAYERSQACLAAQKQAVHPSLRLKGLDEEEPEVDVSDFRENARRVNAQLDSDLDTMSAGLSRLKGLAIGLNDEMTDQNAMLDRIQDKANKVDMTIGSQNTQIKKILKR